MQQITKSQLTKLHVLFHTLNLMEVKKHLIYNYTQGRTESTKDLSLLEAKSLIQTLSKQDPRESHIKAIKHLAYKAGIIYGDTKDDWNMNDAKLNLFLREKGTVKKNLQNMTLPELNKVHRQFEAIVKSNKKSADNKKVKQVVEHLLNELKITVKP